MVWRHAGMTEQDSCSLPLQLSVELHVTTPQFGSMYRGDAPQDFSNLYWTKHVVSLGEIATLTMHLANLGYAVLSREANVWGGEDCCAEFTLLRVEEPYDCKANL